MSKITDILHKRFERVARLLAEFNHTDLRTKKACDINRYSFLLADTESEILKAQWIDGPPKDTGEGRYLLVMSAEIKPVVWDTTEGSLKGDYIDDSLNSK